MEGTFAAGAFWDGVPDAVSGYFRFHSVLGGFYCGLSLCFGSMALVARVSLVDETEKLCGSNHFFLSSDFLPLYCAHVCVHAHDDSFRHDLGLVRDLSVVLSERNCGRQGLALVGSGGSSGSAGGRLL